MNNKEWKLTFYLRGPLKRVEKAFDAMLVEYKKQRLKYHAGMMRGAGDKPSVRRKG